MQFKEVSIVSVLLVLIGLFDVVLCVSRDFIYVSTPMTYENANAYCKSQYGSELVSIRNAVENAAADALCPNQCWIGANDKTTEGTFVWEDGYNIVNRYENWSVNEPVC